MQDMPKGFEHPCFLAEYDKCIVFKKIGTLHVKLCVILW